MHKRTKSSLEGSRQRVAPKPDLKVADEVWIATALLHREHRDRADFSIAEILDRARKESVTEHLRPGVRVHIVQHCVANRPPNPARYRMLYETSRGRRRLFRPGDPYHSGREGGRITPNADQVPPAYQSLLIWYSEWCSVCAVKVAEEDPLLALAGSGRDLWADEHADDYVRRLREGWQ
jgi:hypothetical protein